MSQSGPMTLEEAIEHATIKGADDTDCGAEHRQLAEWLRELHRYKLEKGVAV